MCKNRTSRHCYFTMGVKCSTIHYLYKNKCETNCCELRKKKERIKCNRDKPASHHTEYNLHDKIARFPGPLSY